MDLLANAPELFKIFVRPHGENDSYGGEYVVYRNDRADATALWSFDLGGNGEFTRLTLAIRATVDSCEAEATFEGNGGGPRWVGRVADAGGSFELSLLASCSRSAAGSWPEKVSVTPLSASLPNRGHYISPAPLAAEMAMMSGGSGENSGDSGDCACEIKWANGTAVTDANRNVLPGHQINLKIVCEESPTITDIKWTLPGTVFKDYSTSQAAGTLTKLAAGDLDDETVTFYWADVGDGRTVSVAFKVDGKSCTKSAVLNVKDPTVSYPVINGRNFNLPPIGAPERDDPNSRIILLNAYTGELAGIVFKAEVTLPAGFGFGTGEWHFGQLVERTFVWKLASDQSCTKRDTAGYVNDDPWPYAAGADPAMLPWATGSGVCTVSDSPATTYGGTDQLKYNGKFYMYVMFKPASDPPGAGDSKYVPLRRVPWGTSWCAEKNGTWAIKSSSAVSVTWGVERSHPEWSSYATGDTDVGTTCPGPC